jgi:UDP-N-acetylglucosamine 4,6-dehydratase/UDP-glucose 4-epimerase
MFKDKIIFITGGTGSLGQALTKRLLELNPKQIRIFSRNESKQVEMESKFSDSRLRFLIGDVRDLDRLMRATEDVDYVFHAAALKHVDKVEYNPFESIKTNVNGSQNVIEACLHNDIEKAICIGTDKAVSPLNTYGATKLLMEKLFTSAIHYSNPKKHPTKFLAVRYGNVFGSSGSVIPKFIQQIKNNQKLTITDPEMTRFTITMDDALDFILKATELGQGSEIFIPKLKSYSIQTVRDTLFELLQNSGENIIGIRPGEKLHEVLINKDEIRKTWELDQLYMISNSYSTNEQIFSKYDNVKQVQNMTFYSSENSERIDKNELKNIITKYNMIN